MGCTTELKRTCDLRGERREFNLATSPPRFEYIKRKTGKATTRSSLARSLVSAPTFSHSRCGWAGDTDINVVYTYTLFSLNISKISSPVLNFYALMRLNII